MSDMQPKGIPVEVDGFTYHFYLTIAAADTIQDHYDLPLHEVMSQLMKEPERYSVCAYVTSVLMADEVRRDKLKKKTPTEAQCRDIIDVPKAGELSVSILRAYGFSMPERDEDDDPNRTRRTRKS